MANLEEQLVFGDPLNGFQQVGVEPQFVLQLFLTFLMKEKRKNIFYYKVKKGPGNFSTVTVLLSFWITVFISNIDIESSTDLKEGTV